MTDKEPQLPYIVDMKRKQIAQEVKTKPRLRNTDIINKTRPKCAIIYTSNSSNSSVTSWRGQSSCQYLAPSSPQKKRGFNNKVA